MSGHVPCAECGESVDPSTVDMHECHPQRRVEFQLRAMRRQVLSFESDFREYLSGNKGRFDLWLAARDVRRSRRNA